MIVLDTNIVSEARKPRIDPNVARWLGDQDEFELFLCMPVIAEISAGAHRVFIRDGSMRFVNGLNELIEEFRSRILPMDVAASLRYGEVFAARKARGWPMSSMDAMIAAICLVHNATLATRNVTDFEGLDLKLINPFEAGKPIG